MTEYSNKLNADIIATNKKEDERWRQLNEELFPESYAHIKAEVNRIETDIKFMNN